MGLASAVSWGVGSLMITSGHLKGSPTPGTVHPLWYRVAIAIEYTDG